MKNLRKVMACVLALVMCLGLLPGTANAAGNVSYATIYVGQTLAGIYNVNGSAWNAKATITEGKGSVVTGSYGVKSNIPTYTATGQYRGLESGAWVEITGVGPGTATVVLEYQYSSYSTRQEIIHVTVEEPKSVVNASLTLEKGATETIEIPLSMTGALYPYPDDDDITVTSTTSSNGSVASVTNTSISNSTVSSVVSATQAGTTDICIVADYYIGMMYNLFGDPQIIKCTAVTNVAVTVTDPDPDPTTYTVIYTDGLDGHVFGTETHGKLKAGEDTPECTSNTIRDGYTFKGWNPTWQETVRAQDANAKGEIIYTAVWEEENPTQSTTYKVARKYYVDGVEAATQTSGEKSGTVGQTITVSELLQEKWNRYTMDGETLTFTYADSNPTTFVLGADADKNVITLRYDYTTPQTNNYVLTYDSQGGSTVPADTYSGTEASHTFTVTGTTPTKDGYTFQGWMDTANGTAVQYQAEDEITLTSAEPAKTVYALWACAHDKDGGYCTEDDCTHDGTCCQKAPHQHVDEEPEDGKCDECGECTHNHDAETECGHENCGNDLCKPLPQPEHEHKDEEEPKDGICDDPNCGACLHPHNAVTGACLVEGCAHTGACCKPQTTQPTQPETTYTVTFCANGGTFTNGAHEVTAELKKGAVVTKPAADPTRAGYTFNGWSPTITAVNGNDTYYAQWTKNADPEPVLNPSAQAKIYSMNENTQKVGGTFVFEGVVWNDGNCDITNADFKVVVPREIKLEGENSVHLMYAGSEEPQVTVSDYSETEGTTITWTLNKFEAGRSLVLSLSAKAVATGNFDVQLGFDSENFHEFAFDEESPVSRHARMASAGTTFKPVTAPGTVIPDEPEQCTHEHTTQSITEATCTENGQITFTCDDCGAVVNTIVVQATGHGADRIIPGTPATCTTPGTTASTVCEVCGAVRTPSTIIPATGHSEVTDAAVAPTCTANGKTAGSHCSVCNTVLKAQEIIPATGHSYGNWVTDREPAVGVTGQQHRTCTVCGDTQYNTIPALEEKDPCNHEHTTSAVTKAPTCGEEGEETVTCDDCNEVISTSTIPAAGHVWGEVEVTTAPTCTAAGEGIHTCTTCHESEAVAVEATGHTAGEWEVVTPAGVGVTGLRERHCAVCGELLDSEEIPALTDEGQDPVPVTPPATPVVPDPDPVTPPAATPAEPAPATPATPAPDETDIDNTGIPLDDGTDIQDGETPLAGAIGLNNLEHFAYMLGYGDGTIRPEANITRAEVATIFFRLMTDEFRSANWATENNFSDVSLGQWFNSAISTSANAGKLGGYGDGSFRPNNSITRAEFAAIAVRFLSDEVQGVSGGSFKDTEGHWAAEEIGRAAAAGWITGYGDGTFRPNEYITRAEAAAIINRMLGRVPDAEHMLDEMTVWSDNPATQWYYADIQEATNSHDYDRDELGVTEMWTALQEARDWQALESQWAAQAE